VVAVSLVFALDATRADAIATLQGA
jgi:hypothetical protein